MWDGGVTQILDIEGARILHSESVGLLDLMARGLKRLVFSHPVIAQKKEVKETKHELLKTSSWTQPACWIQGRCWELGAGGCYGGAGEGTESAVAASRA